MPKDTNSNRLAYGVAFGLPFGAIAGMLFFDNIGLGAAFGLAIGVALAAGFSEDDKKTRGKGVDESPEGMG